MDNFWYQNEEEITDIIEHKPNMRIIETLSNENNLFRLIVESLCPQIYGQHLIKSGLVLAVFGGTHKVEPQSKVLSVRANIHVLLFGDHGSNKDLLLKAVHSIAPNTQYVCGNTSTRNSLTTSVKKRRTDEHFQKGSLLSEENAICCIDEFERMDLSQHQIIEEVMEYQKLSSYSDGIYSCLDKWANTSIIAAVNPLNGCYDWSLNVWQNTKLRKTLFSKFDLIFVLVDSPDEEMDSKMSKEICESRRHQKSDPNFIQRANTVLQTTSYDAVDCQLMAKLFIGANEELELVPHEVLKQYISYAQKYVYPALNDEAIDLLEEFYIEFENTLISKSETRTIETLYRLTEARARVELRSIATKEDVMDVIDIVRHSVGKHFKIANIVHTTNTKGLSFRSAKKSQNTKNLLKALKMFSEENKQKVFTFEEIVDICGRFQIPFDSREEITVSVDKLNEQSFLIKNNSNYKLID